MRTLLVLAVLIASGCAGGDSGKVLFSDDFSGTFPAPNWVGEGVVTTTAGTPAPSLYLAPTPPVVIGTVQTSNPVEVAGGLTFGFEAAVPAGAAARVFLLDAQAGGDPIGYVEFRGSGDIVYVISGMAGAVQPATADGQFHLFELRFAEGGTSTWSRDGVVQLQGIATNGATLARVLADVSTETGFFLDELEIRSR